MKVENSLDFSLWSSVTKRISEPYRQGFQHFKMAFTADIFDESKNLQDLKFSKNFKKDRAYHFCSGLILCTPIINEVAKLAMSTLFPPIENPYTEIPAWKRVNHIVVLMFENRSFDNMLGRLYPKSEGFNGLEGNEENTYVDKRGVKHTIKVWDSKGARKNTPNPDPGEEFDDMCYQLFETTQPHFKAHATMKGFAQNYYDFICRDETAQKELRKKRGIDAFDKEFIEPTEDDIADIMHCYSPEAVPVISQLATSFAVSDMYHASAPNQTWPNRFFVHTATANGYENNNPLHFPYTMKSIYTRFNDLKRNNGWKIYFHDLPQSATLSNLWPYPDCFKPFDHFIRDAKKGRLPSYSFIEPRYYQEAKFPSDQHPPHDVRHGELLMAEVYNILRKSPKWKETLLVVTYDEHGGCYDHQTPPAAVPPETPKENQKFHFDRYGVRVPAVFVSPLIAPNTILRPMDGSKAEVFDHTSIIASLRNCFNLGGPLTGRDAVAPDLSNVLNMPIGKYNMGPKEIIAPIAPETTLQEANGLVMNELQKTLLHMSEHLPDNSGFQKNENCYINALRTIHRLAYSNLKKIEDRIEHQQTKDHLLGRELAMKNFANFRST